MEETREEPPLQNDVSAECLGRYERLASVINLPYIVCATEIIQYARLTDPKAIPQRVANERW